MHIEQKQNRIYKPQSVYTYAAEECNQVSTELDNLIREGGLTPSAGDLTQVKTAVNNIVDASAANLQSQIDTITAASDVFDVVGTYAQLQAYDKSSVPLNDIIKVLQDSTHNNAATYYRLVETSGATEWQYIGQEGPYYTKSEIDTDFALKSELPSIATTQQVGLIKPDNSTLIVSQDGTLSASGNVAAALPLFSFVWSIHKINDVSYLLANTFSWQSGNVYTEGYQHLVDDISGITPSTETISGITITYYQANDGDKIVLADQETAVQNIYNATGDARYFILDTTNTRFKLPRWKHNKYQTKAPVIGTGIALGFTNGEVNFGTMAGGNGLDTYQGDYGKAVGTNYSGTRTTSGKVCGIVTDPTKSGIEATLEEDDMYLYFYVGNFSQSATEQTAGLNLELFNEKMDVDGSNATEPLVHFSDFEAFKNLILKETSNMLARIDVDNMEVITLSGAVTFPYEYTFKKDGYVTLTKLNGTNIQSGITFNQAASGGNPSNLTCFYNEKEIVTITPSTAKIDAIGTFIERYSPLVIGTYSSTNTPCGLLSVSAGDKITIIRNSGNRTVNWSGYAGFTFYPQKEN